VLRLSFSNLETMNTTIKMIGIALAIVFGTGLILVGISQLIEKNEYSNTIRIEQVEITIKNQIA